MQQFLKQQAKERALSASLPLISEKRDPRIFVRNLKGKLQQKNKAVLLLDQSQHSFSAQCASSGRNSLSKRYANSFSAFGNRQVHKYAHVQLQKQYKEWEERRQKKKLGEQIATASITSARPDAQKTTELAVLSNVATQSEKAVQNLSDKSKDSSINPESNAPYRTNSERKFIQDEETFGKSALLKQQRASISGPTADTETPSPKKFRPMTTDFSELKFKVRSGKTFNKRTHLFQLKKRTNDSMESLETDIVEAGISNSNINLSLKK